MSMISLYVALRLYTGLAFWMPTIELRVWFLRRSSSAVIALAALPMMFILISVVALPFAAALHSPLGGLIGLIFLIAAGTFALPFENGVAMDCIHKMHTEAHKYAAENQQ